MGAIKLTYYPLNQDFTPQDCLVTLGCGFLKSNTLHQPNHALKTGLSLFKAKAAS